ncbi:uncharacterized protein LOC134071169 isoform X2 [Sardina pilchardus]|uniref:uncharacterized protein LOC134071169 isoform X2 n=1 Tax=Sardina pilchardus TaxID=27697 RepID=UPI002E125233
MLMFLPWSVLSLWLILSVVAEEEYDCQEDLPQQCTPDIDGLGFSVYNSDNGIMKLNQSHCIDEKNPSLPDGLRPINTSCIVERQKNLNISWDSSGLPGHAQYSISYLFCSSSDEEIIKIHNKHVQGSFHHTLIPGQTDYITLLLNVSFPDIWYIQTQHWKVCAVEKLDPLQVNVTIQSNQLYLEWDLPKSRSTENPKCFEYELKVNDEVRKFDGIQHYKEPNLDPTQKHKIKIRVKKTSLCCDPGDTWSDWTVIDLHKSADIPLDIHIGVIIAIALGLPMILLAILLLCKFQRVFDKMFPPIPGPSIKIKGLLEKDITSQILSHKCVEEVTEVEVKENEEEEEHW